MNAKIQTINKVGEHIQVDVMFSDGTLKSYTFSVGSEESEIKQAIREDLNNLSKTETKVQILKTKLENLIIE
jgi:hypothetical protein